MNAEYLLFHTITNPLHTLPLNINKYNILVQRLTTDSMDQLGGSKRVKGCSHMIYEYCCSASVSRVQIVSVAVTLHTRA